MPSADQMGTMPRWDFGPSGTREAMDGGGGGALLANSGAAAAVAANGSRRASGDGGPDGPPQSSGGAGGEWDFSAAESTMRPSGESGEPLSSRVVPVEPLSMSPQPDEAPSSWLHIPPPAPLPTSTAVFFSKSSNNNSNHNNAMPLSIPTAPPAAPPAAPRTSGSLGKSSGTSVAKTLMAAVTGHLPFTGSRQTPPVAPASSTARTLAQQQVQHIGSSGTISSATARALASTTGIAGIGSGKPLSTSGINASPLMTARPKLLSDATANSRGGGRISLENAAAATSAASVGLQPRPPGHSAVVGTGPPSANGGLPLTTTTLYLAASRQQSQQLGGGGGQPPRGPATVNDR